MFERNLNPLQLFAFPLTPCLQTICILAVYRKVTGQSDIYKKKTVCCFVLDHLTQNSVLEIFV